EREADACDANQNVRAHRRDSFVREGDTSLRITSQESCAAAAAERQRRYLFGWRTGTGWTAVGAPDGRHNGPRTRAPRSTDATVAILAAPCEEKSCGVYIESGDARTDERHQRIQL